MIANIRIECPHCGWGYGYNQEDVNQGYRIGVCNHCGNNFKFKITLSKIEVDIQKDTKRNEEKLKDEGFLIYTDALKEAVDNKRINLQEYNYLVKMYHQSCKQKSFEYSNKIYVCKTDKGKKLGYYKGEKIVVVDECNGMCECHYLYNPGGSNNEYITTEHIKKYYKYEGIYYGKL